MCHTFVHVKLSENLMFGYIIIADTEYVYTCVYVPTSVYEQVHKYVKCVLCSNIQLYVVVSHAYLFEIVVYFVLV